MGWLAGGGAARHGILSRADQLQAAGGKFSTFRKLLEGFFPRKQLHYACLYNMGSGVHSPCQTVGNSLPCDAACWLLCPCCRREQVLQTSFQRTPRRGLPWLAQLCLAVVCSDCN